MKTTITTTLLLLSLTTANAQNGIRLILSGTGQPDTLHVPFSSTGTPGFDANLDQAFVPATGNGRNYIFASAANNQKLSINCAPLTDAGYSFSLGTFIQQTGFSNFTLEAESNIPAGTLFALTDIFSQITYALQPGTPLQLYLLSNSLNDPSQYVLHIFPTPIVTTAPAHCADSYDGSISIHFGNTLQWTANIYDSSGFLVNQYVVSGHDTTLTGFSSDSYSVSLNENGLDYYSTAGYVSAPPPVDATFSVVSDSIPTGQNVQIINHAASGNSYSWDFGDNSSPMSCMNPSHSFSSPGSYTITQTVTTPTGCSDYFGLKVDVYEGTPTGISDASTTPVRVSSGNGMITIAVQNVTGNTSVELYDINGKLVARKISTDGNFSLPVETAGIYIVRVINNSTILLNKTFLAGSM